MFQPSPCLINFACFIYSTFYLFTFHLYYVSFLSYLISTGLYFHYISSQLSLISTVSYLFTCLICSIFHIFHVLRLRLFSKPSNFVSSLSHVLESIMFDKSGNVSSKMYIEKKAHPVFWKFFFRSDPQFNLFMEEICAWCFNRYIYLYELLIKMKKQVQDNENRRKADR